MRMRLAAAVFAAMICGSAPVSADTPKKVALVIGNASYQVAALKNPVNDAREMAKTLKEKGFEVILRENTTKTQMETAIADFGEKLEKGATALFFYAGHGMQVSGHNYLIPIDAKLQSEQRVRLETVDVDVVLDQTSAAGAKVTMIVLDACRNNPFERRFRAVGGGLAQINAPEGTFIAYATAPGSVAADGEGANGLYTQEMLKALRQPGLKVEDVFKQVRINVAAATNGAQVPWEASSLTGDFYFTPGDPSNQNAALDEQRAQLAKLQQELAAKQRELAVQHEQLARGLPQASPLEGTYAGSLRLSRAGDVTASFTVEGNKISGFGSKYAEGGPCKISGAVDKKDGTASFTLVCPVKLNSTSTNDYTATFTGKLSEDGPAALKTTFVTNERVSGALDWKKQ